MKLQIQNGNKTMIYLRLPNSFIKSKFIAKALLVKTYDKQSAQQMRKCLKISYKHLKTYVKQQGHFTFLELDSSDNYRIVIKF